MTVFYMDKDLQVVGSASSASTDLKPIITDNNDDVPYKSGISREGCATCHVVYMLHVVIATYFVGTGSMT